MNIFWGDGVVFILLFIRKRLFHYFKKRNGFFHFIYAFRAVVRRFRKPAQLRQYLQLYKREANKTDLTSHSIQRTKV